MLLIDGVKYEEWTDLKETEDLEPMVIEHAQDIFGKNSIYFDKKQKLKSLAGVGSIPDGLVIMFGSVPQWHIVEVELSSHDPYAHIVPQVDKFINGIDNQNTRNKLVDTLYNVINSDELLRRETRQAIGLDKDIHKFLADLITTPPTITIIIEKDTDQLEEALRKYEQKKVIEFQTFRRVEAESVHAHLFEPLYAVLPSSPLPPIHTPDKAQKIKPPRGPVKAGRVTFEELISAGVLKDGQILYFYNTRPFMDERAQVIASSNQLKYEGDGRTYSKSELAKQLLIKHDFKHDEYGVAGPKYWKTEAGEFLRDLEEQIRSRRGDRL
jgi:hypothetical protein